ncbi:unnamed protein product [Schistosoma mattheei]|uniref:Uncharacterized protein n=1 Tax=Schistosoma mattheei TaxID=31246 RepID=A0A183PB61_9TREM|nr:unnamed protein product [Schistosoma mattheei]
MPEDDQKVKDFILELQKQSAKYNFGEQMTTQIRDCLIAGINIQNLESELILKPKSSFQEIKIACVNYEAVNGLDFQSVKISNTSLIRRDELHSQCRSSSRLVNNGSDSRENIKSELQSRL